MAEVKLTQAQAKALRMIERRDWPAGEPRASWIGKATLAVLERNGLVAERPGSAIPGNWWARTHILELTPAGRQALQDQSNG